MNNTTGRKHATQAKLEAGPVLDEVLPCWKLDPCCKAGSWPQKRRLLRAAIANRARSPTAAVALLWRNGRILRRVYIALVAAEVVPAQARQLPLVQHERLRGRTAITASWGPPFPPDRDHPPWVELQARREHAHPTPR